MPKTSSDFLEILPLNQVLDTIPSGLFLVDRRQHIVYWNAEAERITGYTAAQALGQHCSFLEGIECGQGCGLYNAAVRKPIIGANCTIRTRDGRQVHLSKNVDYLMHNGEVVGGIESFVDLTQQKNLEYKLRQHASHLEETVKQRTAELEEERRRLTLLEAMDDLAYITNADYTVEFVNRAIRDVFGDVIGQTCHKAFYAADSVCQSCPMEKILAGQTVREERSNPISGRIYEILHTPLVTGGGQVQKLAVCRDITERKEAEEALRAANLELDSFVHTVSHDLRTPLTPIIGYAEYLLEEYGKQFDPKIAGIIREIENQGHKMCKILEDLLELSRVGWIETPAKPIVTAGVVDDVLEELRELIATKQAQVEVETLPDARIPATLLHQLFANLIGNALQYGCSGSQPRVEVGGTRQGQTLKFFVRDFGPGIPEEERERIFEVFFRGSSGKQTLGTGIGLGTVRKIARLFNGCAWVEKTPGGGSTFWVELQEPEPSPDQPYPS